MGTSSITSPMSVLAEQFQRYLDLELQRRQIGSWPHSTVSSVQPPGPARPVELLIHEIISRVGLRGLLARVTDAELYDEIKRRHHDAKEAGTIRSDDWAPKP